MCCDRAKKQFTMYMIPSNLATINITVVFSGMEGLLDYVLTTVHMTF